MREEIIYGSITAGALGVFVALLLASLVWGTCL